MPPRSKSSSARSDPRQIKGSHRSGCRRSSASTHSPRTQLPRGTFSCRSSALSRREAPACKEPPPPWIARQERGEEPQEPAPKPSHQRGRSRIRGILLADDRPTRKTNLEEQPVSDPGGILADLMESEIRTPEMEMAETGADVPDAADLALDDINPANPHLFSENRWHDHFARLRAEDPVHLNELETAGRYWSVTKYDDVRAVDGDWKTFSSARGITLGACAAARDVDARCERDHARSSRWIRRSTPSSARRCGACRRRATCATLEPLIRERTVARARVAARGRDVRLGRHRVDRADHPDAGHAVRLPDRGPPQADPLVRHRVRGPRTRWGRRDPAAEDRTS